MLYTLPKRRPGVAVLTALVGIVAAVVASAGVAATTESASGQGTLDNGTRTFSFSSMSAGTIARSFSRTIRAACSAAPVKTRSIWVIW